MLPSGGSITGFNPNSGGNSFYEDDTTNPTTNPTPTGGDALSQLYSLAQTNPEYMETYLQLLAERENTTNAQAWYEKMSSTQYQRAMADLKAAGVNPMLALTSLSGAGSGSVQPAGTWSTSPYANKMTNESLKNQTSKIGLAALGLVFGFVGQFLKALGS